METFRSEISLYLITTTMQYDSLNSVCADSCKPGMFPAGPTAPESITVLLSRVNGGDRCAFDFLIPLVYQELTESRKAICAASRRIARCSPPR